MEIKSSAPYVIQGMNQDLGEAVYNPQFSFENRNIKIVADKDNTAFTITSEQGNERIYFDRDIEGVCIGSATLSNYIIIFTHSDL